MQPVYHIAIVCQSAWQAIRWQAAKNSSEIIAAREEMTSQIEFAASELRKSGTNAHWFRECDDITKHVSEGVNGFLFQELLGASHHRDQSAADLFREGANIAHVSALCCACCA